MNKNIIRFFVIVCSVFISASAVSALTPEQEAEALNVGKKLIFEGKLEEGIRVLEEAAGQGKNPNIMLYLGKGYSWKGNYPRALEYYGQVQSITKADDNNYWLAQFGIAQVTSWQQKFNEAIALYNRIITDYKKIPVYLITETYLAIGDIYSWRLEYPKAIEYFNMALKYDPQSIDAYNKIAKIFLWSKNYKESKKYSQMALAVDKNNIEAKNRIEQLNLLWNYTVSIENKLTFFDANNYKGNQIRQNSTVAAFDWPVNENFGVHFETTYLTQNSVDVNLDKYNTITDIDERNKAIENAEEDASKWKSDINAGLGINGKALENTYYTLKFNYTFNSQILPDWTAETELSRKITTNFDVLIGYELLHDSKYEDQKRNSPDTHSMDAGIIYYLSDYSFSQVQFFFDINGKDKYYSILFHQTLAVTSMDKVEIYLSYGEGTNYLNYSTSTVPVNVITTGISISYLHYFSAKFGIKPEVEYHYRINSYRDIAFGIQAVYNI